MTLFFDGNGNIGSKILNAHCQADYVIWINSAFFGNEGWYESELDGVTVPAGVESIGAGCFAGATGTVFLAADNWIESVGDTGFLNCVNMTGELTRPLVFLGGSAFENCTGLTGTVTISGAVKSIKPHTFYGCTGIVEVFISDGVESIGNAAFFGCSGIGELTVPAGIRYSFNVDEWTTQFSGCTSISHVTIIGSGEMPAPELWEAADSYHITPWKIASEAGTDVTVDVGEGVTAIGNGVFRYCANLVSVSLPSTLERMGESAFEGCVRMAADLPDGIENVGEGAFVNCSSMETDLPDELTTVGPRAFAGCSGLTGTLPAGVTELGWGAFENCTGLTGTVTIPEALTAIEPRVFYGCSGIEALVIPESVEEIGNAAFFGCSGIEELTVPAGIRYSFNVDEWTTQFSGCTSISHVTIIGSGEMPAPELWEAADSYHITPWKIASEAGTDVTVDVGEGVTAIGNGVFRYCANLVSVSLPSTLESIGDYAFEGCSRYASADFTGSAPEMGECVFDWCADGFKVTCTADNRSSFVSGPYYNAADGTWHGYPLEILGEIEALTVTDPSDQTVEIGGTAQFSVTVTGGTAPYSCQWQYRKTVTGAWINISAASARTDTYTLTVLERHNGYQYRCRVTDALGQTAVSDFATLTVETPATPLTVDVQPEDQTVEPGSTARFSVTVTGGTAPYKYQWQYRTSQTGSWVNVSAASGKTDNYTLTAQARHNGYQYQCRITDAAGQTVMSDTAVLTVGTPAASLTVDVQPVSQSVGAGSKVSFSVTVTGGTAPYRYQWQYRKTATGAWVNVAAASGRTDTYTLTAEARHNGYQYQCVITDGKGQTITSDIAVLTVGGGVVVTNEPVDVRVSVGETAVFRVSVSGGTAPYRYQWQYLKPNTTSWVNVAAASGKTAEYTMKAEARHNGYQYRCAVTDNAGSTVMTKAVRLTVGAETELAIVTQPSMQTVSVGDTAVFSVTVEGGTAPYRYQWQYLKPDASAWANVAAASGKTDTYTMTAQARHDGYVYRCKITDAAGTSIISKNAVLVVGSGHNKIADLVAMIPDYGVDFPVLDLTAEEEVLWDLGELNEADLPVLPTEISFIGFAGAELPAESSFELTADFNDETAAFWGDLSAYDYDEAVDGYEAE